MSYIDPRIEDEVMLHPARAVAATPGLHDEPTLRFAIIVLKSRGDWLDHERATQLERQLDVETSREASRDDLLEVVLDFLDVVTLFAALIGMFCFADVMGWM